MQYATLTRNLRSVMMEYNTLETAHREEMKNMVKRKLRTAGRRSKSSNNLNNTVCVFSLYNLYSSVNHSVVWSVYVLLLSDFSAGSESSLEITDEKLEEMVESKDSILAQNVMKIKSSRQFKHYVSRSLTDTHKHCQQKKGP